MLETRIEFLYKNTQQIHELQITLFNIIDTINKTNEILEGLEPLQNLKVYNIANLLHELEEKNILNDEEKLNIFSRVTIGEYENFVEFEKEFVDLPKRNYIGHSSTFVYEYLDGDFFNITKEGEDYKKLSLKNEFPIIRFCEVGLIKTLLHLPLSKDEETYLHNAILSTLINFNNQEQNELLENVELTLEELSENALYSLQAAEQINLVHGYLSDYKTVKNSIEILKEYVTDQESVFDYLENRQI